MYMCHNPAKNTRWEWRFMRTFKEQSHLSFWWCCCCPCCDLALKENEFVTDYSDVWILEEGWWADLFDLKTVCLWSVLVTGECGVSNLKIWNLFSWRCMVRRSNSSFWTKNGLSVIRKIKGVLSKWEPIFCNVFLLSPFSTSTMVSLWLLQ